MNIFGRFRRSWPREITAAFFVLAGVVAPALAASPDDGAGDAGRPRIGLVLSGGGARGAAHVGVLQVMEALRIPVDYVAGTSMGSISGSVSTPTTTSTSRAGACTAASTWLARSNPWAPTMT